MPRLTQLLLPAMALVALVSAQVFGMGRGFVCDCGGVETVTLEEHCHGPHSAACHEHEHEHEHEAAEPCRGGEDHREDDSHEHEALSESLRASVPPGLEFSAPVLTVVCLELEEWHLPVLMPGVRSLAAGVWLDSGQAARRSWPQVLAHAVALRV